MGIFLLRHGESTGDVEKRYGGWYDDDLSDFGRVEISQIIPTLRSKDIQAIITSSLRRARQTAEIVSEALGIGFETDANLKERNYYGILSGMTFDDAKKQYPEHVFSLPNPTSPIPDREPLEIFEHRIRYALDLLDTTRNTLVITHGGPMRYIFREILHMGELQAIADCALIQLEKDQQSQFQLIDQIGISFPPTSISP